MVNIPIIPPASEIHTDLLPDISQTWKVGQVLHATVERGGENLDKILLRIGHQILESKTPLPLKTGEHIKVLVKSLGEAPLLGIVTPTSTAQQAASQLKKFIAANQDWRPLLDLTVKILTSQPSLTSNIKPLLQNLLQQVPDPEKLSQPQTLRRLIDNSGFMLESRLAQRQNIEGDTKGQLQQLHTLLQTRSPVASSTSHPEQAIRLIETWIRQGLPPLPIITQDLGALISPGNMRQLLQTIQLLQAPIPTQPNQPEAPRPISHTINPEQPDLPQPPSQTINHSGILLESHLVQTLNTGGNPRGLLLQLQALLQNLSPTAANNSHPEPAIQLIKNWISNSLPPLPLIVRELSPLISPNDMQQLLQQIQMQQLDNPLTLKLMQLTAEVQKQHGKAALEQLLKLIDDQNNIGELKAAISQAISHISQQQLLPLLRDGDNSLLLLFGLPIRHDHDTHWINFRIEREKSGAEQQEKSWHVTLNFDIAELGPLQAKLHLSGKALSTLFRASEPRTIEKIRQHLPQLQRVLQNSGLQIIKLDVLPGQIENQPVISSQTHILDERA